MEEFIGKSVIVEVTTVFKDDWFECTHIYKQSRSKDLKNWEEKQIGLKAYGKTPEKAYAEVLLQLTKYMDKSGFDLFSEEDGNTKSIEAGET